MEPIRLGIVGPGLIWENAHRPALAPLVPGTYSLRAFSGRSQASRDKIARDYPDAAFHHDYHDLVARDDVDAVVVLTPIALNARVAMAALAAGKDVYLEKPMAASLAEGLELAARAEEAGRHVFILEQSAYRAAYRVARERIQAGDIGVPLAYERASHGLFDAGAHSVRGYGRTAWRQQPDFPLGTLFDGGHHQLAAIAEMLGAPTAVVAHGHNLRPDYGEYDVVLMLFEHPGALRGMFSYSDYLGGERNYMLIRGTEGLLAFDRRRLTLSDREGHERPIDVPEENTHRRMWRDIAACTRDLDDSGRSDVCCYGIAEGLRELRTLEAVDRSAHSGGIRVPIEGPAPW
jgi:scyllo-inositol 2-dehydrogenase (NADP+)